MSTSSHRYTSSFKRGFTLIELLVVVAIISITSAFILVRQQRFDSSTLLRSLSYSVALSVRQAQVYGSSVLGTTTTSTGCVGGNFSAPTNTCFAAAYGMDISMPSHAPVSSYTLFADLDNSGAYTVGGSEDIKIFNLSTGYTITTACALNGSDLYCTASCPPTVINGVTVPLPFNATTCSAGYLKTLDIVFRRPNLDACFSTDHEPSVCQSGQIPFYSAAYVQVSGGDNTRGVTVSSTGEIAVGTAGT
ncbi:MAG: type II secretion system protein [Patescibacteria group bacterium]|nr:type II secretion system protein [Patescibacteria group bacterium]